MIIGSTALNYHGIDMSANDLDVFITSESQSIDYPNSDWHIVPEYIYRLIYDSSGYATPETILTLKMSHLSWDIKWNKTKKHIIGLLNLGHKPNRTNYIILKDYWESVHGNKDFLSLNKSKDKFFTDSVSYVHDHDYLHKLVAYPNNPMYTKCLKDNKEVLIDKDKFFMLSLAEQLQMFREEITVIAIERWLVNPTNKGKYSFVKAYNRALQKTITNLTKNWATDFIIFNIKELSKPKYKYFKYALQTLEIENMVDKTVFENYLKELQECGYSDYDMDYLLFNMAQGEVGEICDDAETLPSKYCYIHLEQDGGGEGGGEGCYGVFELGGKIYKVDYNYYSYDGYNYENIQETLREVKHTLETISVYK